MIRPLLLGGTTEASGLARALAAAGVDAIFSYAGRTHLPSAQPLRQRIGGFGGAGGLARYLRDDGITHLIDATHPFAAQMSRNAIEASALAGVPLIAMERTPWIAAPGDRWQHVADSAAAVTALPEQPSRVFLAIGRQAIADFAQAPRHHYVLRLVDEPDAPLALPDAVALIARGPFTEENDRNLLISNRIDVVVAKNSGGSGARAKLDAARSLGLPVILIDRPAIPDRPRVETIEAVLRWLGHPARLGV